MPLSFSARLSTFALVPVVLLVHVQELDEPFVGKVIETPYPLLQLL